MRYWSSVTKEDLVGLQAHSFPNNSLIPMMQNLGRHDYQLLLLMLVHKAEVWTGTKSQDESLRISSMSIFCLSLIFLANVLHVEGMNTVIVSANGSFVCLPGRCLFPVSNRKDYTTVMENLKRTQIYYSAHCMSVLGRGFHRKSSEDDWQKVSEIQFL